MLEKSCPVRLPVDETTGRATVARSPTAAAEQVIPMNGGSSGGLVWSVCPGCCRSMVLDSQSRYEIKSGALLLRLTVGG